MAATIRSWQIAALVMSGSLGASLQVAYAQDKQQFAQAQRENKEALAHYTWKSRTELVMKSESKNVKLEQVRYDLDGKLQKTDIGGAPQEQPSQQTGRQGGRRGRGRVKQRVIENKKEEFAELMQNLGKLVGSYAHLPPERMQAFAEGASLSPGQGELEGTVNIRSADVLQAGDSMSVWVDPATYAMRRLEIHSAFEEKPVSLTIEFQTLVDGPTYPARSILDYPDKEVELTVENYDYQRVGS